MERAVAILQEHGDLIAELIARNRRLEERVSRLEQVQARERLPEPDPYEHVRRRPLHERLRYPAGRTPNPPRRPPTPTRNEPSQPNQGLVHYARPHVRTREPEPVNPPEDANETSGSDDSDRMNVEDEPGTWEMIPTPMAVGPERSSPASPPPSPPTRRLSEQFEQ